MEKKRNTDVALFAFRALARFGSCINELVREVHKGSPYDLFLAVVRHRNDADKLDALLKKPKCLRSSFAERFLTKYNTIALLQSEDAQQEALLMATIWEETTVSIEKGFSHVKRNKDLASMTWEASFTKMSADHIMSNARADKEERTVRERKATDKTPKVDGAVKKKRRGGGGAWREYYRSRLRGTKGLPQPHVVQQIARDYHNLPPDQRSAWLEIGQAATQGQRLFGTRVKKLRRQPTAAHRAAPVSQALVVRRTALEYLDAEKCRIRREAADICATERAQDAADVEGSRYYYGVLTLVAIAAPSTNPSKPKESCDSLFKHVSVKIFWEPQNYVFAISQTINHTPG